MEIQRVNYNFIFDILFLKLGHANLHIFTIGFHVYVHVRKVVRVVRMICVVRVVRVVCVVCVVRVVRTVLLTGRHFVRTIRLEEIHCET